MPFPFTLPTTSSFSFSSAFECSSHPSLPLTVNTYRGVLRDALKKHKRIPPAAQSTNLSTILQAVEAYLPYLLALDSGLSSKLVSGEEIDVVLSHSPALEWRPILSSSPIPGREPPRLKLHSLEYEIIFVLSTLGHTQTLLARSALQPLYTISAASPTQEARTSYIQNATKSLLLAASVYAHAASRLSSVATSGLAPSSPDLSPAAHTALSSLAHAEATLLAVLKDDPYPSALSQTLNKNDKDWMIKAPSIPKVRAHLFARLCLAASEHAAKAVALLRGSGKVDSELISYVEDLRIVGKAKACRFFGIDAELGGETAAGIAWLRAARTTLKLSIEAPSRPSKFSLSGMRSKHNDKKEERRIENSGDWGSDAGRAEEGRIVSYLMLKWEKMNDVVNTQSIPAEGPLLATMPSGREIHIIRPWQEPELDDGTLATLRAPPWKTDDGEEAAGESSDDDGGFAQDGNVVGAFPGTKGDYAGSGSYY